MITEAQFTYYGLTILLIVCSTLFVIGMIFILYDWIKKMVNKND